MEFDSYDFKANVVLVKLKFTTIKFILFIYCYIMFFFAKKYRDYEKKPSSDPSRIFLCKCVQKKPSTSD
jgi:hypothetical protein